MSRWEEKLESHQIHESLRQLNEWLEFEFEEIDVDEREELLRFRKVLDLTTSVVSGLDAKIAPENLLETLNNQFQQPAIWNEINAYRSSRSVQHIRNANDNLGSVIQTVYQLGSFHNAVDLTESVKRVERAFEGFSKKVAKREKEVEEAILANKLLAESMENNLKEIETKVNRLAEQANEAFLNWQTEYTSAQTSRAEEFSSAQIARASKFDVSVRELREKSEANMKVITEEHQKNLRESFEDFEESISTKLSDAAKRYEDILEIHGLVGKDAVAGGYQRGEENERGAANLWRIIAMGSFVAAGIWIGVKYYFDFQVEPVGDLDWFKLISTTSLTLVLIGMGGYAARQSAIHRVAEQKLRWFALEVKAIDPFLSSLPEENRNALKDQLAQKLFGSNHKSVNDRDVNIHPTAVRAISEAVVSILKAVGKS